MNDFAEELIKAQTAPKTLRAGDDRCYAIMRDLCAKTGIELAREEELEALDEVRRDLLEHMGMDEDGEPDFDQLEQLCENLMQMYHARLYVWRGACGLNRVPPPCSTARLPAAA